MEDVQILVFTNVLVTFTNIHRGVSPWRKLQPEVDDASTFLYNKAQLPSVLNVYIKYFNCFIIQHQHYLHDNINNFDSLAYVIFG